MLYCGRNTQPSGHSIMFERFEKVFRVHAVHAVLGGIDDTIVYQAFKWSN